MSDDSKTEFDISALRATVRSLGLSPHDYRKDNAETFEADKQLEKELIKGIEIKDPKNIGNNVIAGILTYKEIPVLVYIYNLLKPLAYLKDDGKKYNKLHYLNKFHIGWCATLQDMHKRGYYESKYIRTTKSNGIFKVSAYKNKNSNERKKHEQELLVCQNCLDLFNWNGFVLEHAPRNERQRQVEEFDIQNFLDEMKGFIRYLKMPERDDTTLPLSKYPAEFHKISRKLKEEKKYTCEECKVYLGAKNYRQFLHTHHIDKNISNNNISNLKVICFTCHSVYHPHLKKDTRDRFESNKCFNKCNWIRIEQGIL